jgi:hypothetical protein
VALCTPSSTAGYDSESSLLSEPPVSPSQTAGTLFTTGMPAGQDYSLPLSGVESVKHLVLGKTYAQNPSSVVRPYLDQYIFYENSQPAEESVQDEEVNDVEVPENQENDDNPAENEFPKNEEISEAVSTPAAVPDPEIANSETVQELAVAKMPAVRDLPSAATGTTFQPKSKTFATLKHQGKWPFPKLNPIATFREYLNNPADISYNELYARTANVADTLAQYQKEWDELDRITRAHEAAEKATKKRAEENVKDAKEEADGKKNWKPQEPEVEQSKNRRGGLIDTPVYPPKVTKEEIEFEKRKRGRLVDADRFEDMKQADVYGLKWSAHNSHVGQQPLENMVRNRQAEAGLGNGSAVDNQAGGRAQRNKPKRSYDEVEQSVTPESDQELPAKRARKPRIFDDEAEARGSRASSHGGASFFPSGKRVGRPPKSKLGEVQMATATERSTPGEENSVQVSKQHISIADVEKLQNSAQNLEDKMNADKTGLPILPVRQKHAGGRPKKVVSQPSDFIAPPESVPAAIAKNRGGRPRKHPLPDTVAPQNVIQPDPKPRETKKRSAMGDSTIKVDTTRLFDNVPQLGEADEVLQSTEQDDGSRFASTETSRPTTSSSNETASTFTRRSARPATRNKTALREANGARVSNEDTKIDDPSSSASTRSKRKRATAETEPSPIVVDAPIPIDQLSPKRVRRAPIKIDDADGLATENSPVRIKRKRGEGVPAEDETIPKKGKKPTKIDKSQPQEELPPAAALPEPSAKRSKKSDRPRAGHGNAAEEGHEEEEDDDDEDLSPGTREARRKERVKKRKSKKLSIAMTNRWASGGMEGAQKTRAENNDQKKKEKEKAKMAAATVATGGKTTVSQPSAPAPIVPSAPSAPFVSAREAAPKTPAGSPAKGSPRKKTKRENPPAREPSTRTKRPPRSLGYDGAADEEEEEELDKQVVSEYERYRAITGFNSPELGKRVRKSRYDLSRALEDGSEDDLFEA